MKNLKILLTFSLGLSTLLNAQDLYVSPSSFVFVQDQVLFVNNDIRLEESDSNIYLRGDAQLLQKNSNTKNSDIGELSVYQKQTTGIYEYNFWSSPVGVGVQGDQATGANANFDITNIHQPDDHTANSNVASTEYGTIGGYNSTASQIANYWLWKMVAEEGYAGWSHISNTGDAEAGLGFTMKGSPTLNNTIDFRGRPNTGTITQSCKYSGSLTPVVAGLVNTLTGNPYPCAMDLLLFLKNPTNEISLDGSVYFWEQKPKSSHLLLDYEGGYAVWTPDTKLPNDKGTYVKATFGAYDENGNEIGSTTGESNEYTDDFTRRYAAIGQGFMVRNGSGNTGDFEINNSMRVYMPQAADRTSAGSQFGRMSSKNKKENRNQPLVAMSHNGLDYMDILENPNIIPKIRIHTKMNDRYIRENVLTFNPEKNNEFNKFGDALTPSVLATDTYFIANNNYKLAIKSIAYGIDAKLPFGLNALNETNTYSITINKMTDVSESVEVYIHDKELGTYNDIKNGSYDITLPQGQYNDRFEIVFKDASQQIIDEIIETEAEVTGSFDVYQNNTANQFVIKNPQSHIVKLFVMYDITGKVIYNKQNLGNEIEYNFPTNNLSSGTYITKITTDQNFEITKKVIVNN